MFGATKASPDNTKGSQAMLGSNSCPWLATYTLQAPDIFMTPKLFLKTKTEGEDMANVVEDMYCLCENQSKIPGTAGQSYHNLPTSLGSSSGYLKTLGRMTLVPTHCMYDLQQLTPGPTTKRENISRKMKQTIFCSQFCFPKIF